MGDTKPSRGYSKLRQTEVTAHQAEAKHLDPGTCLRPSQQREKDSDPLKFPFVYQVLLPILDVSRIPDPSPPSPSLWDLNILIGRSGCTPGTIGTGYCMRQNRPPRLSTG